MALLVEINASILIAQDQYINKSMFKFKNITFLKLGHANSIFVYKLRQF